MPRTILAGVEPDPREAREENRERRSHDEKPSPIRPGAAPADEHEEQQPDRCRTDDACCRRRGERRCEEERLDLVRDPVEPATAVGMRADRRQRVDLRPGRENDEERRQEADDRGHEHGRTEREHERAEARHDSEDRDHGRRLVDADRAEEQRRPERDGSDEHGGAARQRAAGENPERRESDEPADEHEGCARAGVVRAREL